MSERTTTVTNVPIGARRSCTSASLKIKATISQPRAAPPRPTSARSGSVRASSSARCPIQLFLIWKACVLIRPCTHMVQALGCESQSSLLGCQCDRVYWFQRRMRREVPIHSLVEISQRINSIQYLNNCVRFVRNEQFDNVDHRRQAKGFPDLVHRPRSVLWQVAEGSGVTLRERRAWIAYPQLVPELHIGLLSPKRNRRR